MFGRSKAKKDSEHVDLYEGGYGGRSKKGDVDGDDEDRRFEQRALLGRSRRDNSNTYQDGDDSLYKFKKNTSLTRTYEIFLETEKS